MNKRYLLPSLAFVVVLSPVILGCTCVSSPLDKRFRNASAVFVGGYYEFDKSDIPHIQNYRNGLPVLLVKRAWKGIDRELVAVDFDAPPTFGTCPILLQFEGGIDYLVFAYGSKLSVQAECSDTKKLTTTFDQVHKDLSRLDSFWFRLKARVWRF